MRIRSQGAPLASASAAFLATASFAALSVPTLPMLSLSIGVSEVELGLIVAAAFLVAAITTRADWDSRRSTVVVAGLVLLLLVPVLYAFASNSWYLLLARVLHGAALGFVPVTAVSAADAIGNWRRGGVIPAGPILGWIAGPVAGGWLYLNQGLPAVCLAAGAMAVLALLLVFVVPAARHCLAEGVVIDGQPFPQGQRSAARFVVGSLEAFLPIYAIGVGLSAFQVGGAYALCVLAGFIAAPFAASLRSLVPVGVGIIGLILFGLAMGVLALAANVVFVAISMVLLGIGVATSTAAANPRWAFDGAAIKRWGAGDLASVGAQVAGPIVVGLGIVVAGYSTAWLALAMFVAAVAVIVAVVTPAHAYKRVDREDDHQP